MNPRNHSRARRVGAVLLACATAGLAAGALAKGATAWSKRTETKLLAEPKPLAAPVGKVGFGESLTVLEARGAWLNVKAKGTVGWVFQGNVAEEKPELAPPAGFLSVEANDTTTSAAARPLTAVGKGYAQRSGTNTAVDDLDWLEIESGKIGPGVVNAYLRSNKKGEFQE